jgi:uncharacterized protein YydD (DUF2326 family)
MFKMKSFLVYKNEHEVLKEFEKLGTSSSRVNIVLQNQASKQCNNTHSVQSSTCKQCIRLIDYGLMGC